MAKSIDSVEYFTYINSVILLKDLFDLPYSVVLILFINGDLADPKSDPIGLYYQSGVKKYLWKDRIWYETWLDIRKLEEKLKTLALGADYEKMVDLYKILPLNHLSETVTVHCRAITLDLNQNRA